MSGHPVRRSAVARAAESIRAAAANTERSGIVVRLVVAYLAIAAAGRLAYALPRLVYDLEEWSAWDLRYRHNEVQQWFAGNPVYGVVDGAVYPPAAHVILWPFLGWLPFDAARWLWAGTTLAAAVALALIAAAVIRTADPWQRLLAAGLAFAAYPLQQSLFIGQMGVHVAAFATIGAALLVRDRPDAVRDGFGALALAASLMKPTVALPLVVATLIGVRRVRPAVLTIAVYAVLTALAVALQPAGPVALIRDWLAVAGARVPVLEGVPNLHLVLAHLGLRPLATTASLLVLAGAALWMWQNRRADPWLLLGVAAIVARFWAHSTLYDDAFLLLPVIALLRIRTLYPEHAALAALLAAGAILALLTPTWAFYDLGAGARTAIHAVQTVLWTGVLLYIGATVRAYQRPAANHRTISTQDRGPRARSVSGTQP
jgi:hypothetical protein